MSKVFNESQVSFIDRIKKNILKPYHPPMISKEDGRIYNVYSFPLHRHNIIPEKELQSFVEELSYDDISEEPENMEKIFKGLCKSGYLESVEHLLKLGIDPDISEIHDSPPSSILCELNAELNSDIIVLLLKYGADSNYQDYNGNTPSINSIHSPTTHNKKKYFIELLVENNANLDIKNNESVDIYDIAKSYCKFDWLISTNKN